VQEPRQLVELATDCKETSEFKWATSVASTAAKRRFELGIEVGLLAAFAVEIQAEDAKLAFV
jgi:hypothetical protein